MKTIKEAYEELKGDLKNSRSPDSTYNYLFFDIKGEYYIGHEDRDFFSDTYARYICTVEEFNNYKGDDVKTPLETPIDDNSMQYKISNIGNVLHNIACSTIDDDEQNELGAHASFLWDLSKRHAAVTVGKTEDSRPVYTQAMCDAGELPSVGMEYLDDDGQISKCLVNYGDITIGLNVEHVDTKDYLPISQTSRGNCKPLTPPIELIDGKAYQFDSGKYTFVGFWNKNANAFYDTKCFDENLAGFKACTNIKPLTVEGE